MTPAPTRQHSTGRARPRVARAVALVGVLVGVSVATAACASNSRVELDSANAPVVVPVDGEHPNDPAVIDAGAIEIDDSSTSVEPTTSLGRSTPSSTDGAPSTTAPAAPRAETEAACRREQRTLEDAVAQFRLDSGRSPTSEGELIIDSYIRAVSELYDVRYDGTVVAQGPTCAGVD